MTTVDERIVQMKFENAAFQQGVQQTISSLERLNKSLQLQGSTKGLQGVSVIAQQFDQHITRTRNSLGQFTTGIQQSSTVAQSFGQKMETSQGILGRFATGFSSVVSHVTTFGQKVEAGRNSLGQFTSGLTSTGGAADRASSSLKNIENNVSSLAGKFSALSTMATGALLSIGARASQAGLQLANSFTFAPILSGFHEYETNLNSIQTILANTAAAGTNLKDVNGALNELNHYADQTIYNFSEMAKNIGTFTAAGVGLKESTAAIKGIANLAALSGSNSEQASGAMYQLSQAISAGRVSLEDWNSVVNAGMGGTVFQRALAMNAEKMGTLKDGAVKLKGEMKNVTISGKSFRESITAKPGEESWLTSKVLTRTLSQFTGDLSNAQLKAQGFNKEQIAAIQKQAKMAKEAATQVKTFSQLMDTTKESIGSGWTTTWQLIFGDFTEAKGLFTGVSKSIGKIVGDSSDARNKMLKEWKKFGGRDALIEGLGNAFKALGSVIKPIKDAFREIFPATTGKQLASMTKSFADFMGKLKLGSETAANLKRTFAGVFAIFGIGWEIIKQVAKTIFGLFGEVGKGSGGFLKATASVGDFFVALHKAVKEGDGLKKFFEGLGKILAIPIKLVQKLGGYLADLFKGGSGNDAAKKVTDLASKLSPMGKLGDMAAKAWDRFSQVMDRVWEGIKKVGSKIGDALSTMFGGMNINFGDILKGVNTGLLAGLFLVIKNFLSGLGDNGPLGFLEGLRDALDGVTGVLKGMQNALKAAVLLQIAIAIGILAVSMNILSKIDANGLKRASAAMSVMFAQLLGSLAIFQKFIGSAGFAKMPFVMGSLILLAAAVLILASAVKKLSGLDWNELAKGLTGLAIVLGLVVGSLKLMPPTSGMISTGLGMIALAAAIKILASAVKDLSGLGWNELAKGLVGVGVVLGALTLFTMFSKADKGGLAQGAGILLLAAGIKILASAVKDMSKMSWNEIAKGLVTLAGALGIITGALMLIPPTAPLAAAGVLGVAISLGMVADALADLAKMSWAEIGSSLTVMLGALAIIAAALVIIPPTAPLGAAAILLVALSLKMIGQTLSDFAAFSWEEIAKAVVLLGATLGIIAGAMLLMVTALPGAAATLIISAALLILAPVLERFGQMSWEEIGKGLLMLAGVFVIFAAAGLLLAPVIPLMIGLAAAITLLGVGMLAAGAGIFLFGLGLTAIAAAGAAAAVIMVKFVKDMIGLIPLVLEQIGKGIIAFAGVIATSGPAITRAMVTVLSSLLDAMGKLIPKIVATLLKMLLQMLQAMAKYVPKMVDAGLRLLTGILRGIADNIGKVATQATRVVTEFLKAIGQNIPKVVDAGFKMVIETIRGVRKAVDANSETLGREGGKLAVAIIRGMVKGINAGMGQISSAAGRVASAALNKAKSVLGIHSPSKEFEKVGKYVNDGFKKGLDGNKSEVYKAFDDLKKMLLDLSKSSKASSAERKKAASAYTTLTKQLNDEKSAIGKLADKYDVLTDKIKTAQDAYDAAVKTRDDYKTSISDQYGDVASAGADTTVAQFKENLKKQIEDTKQFANTLQRLRALGLNDEMYKDLLTTGTSALPFADELLAGGKAGVDEVNALGKDLDTVAGKLGKDASSALYDAGVNAAKGLVLGLQAQQHVLEAMMDKLASKMVTAIKSKLKIKSPSRVFEKLGGFSAQGLINGLANMSGSVEKAAESTGTAAVESLRKSLSGFSDLVTHDVDIQPVITPVLDLSSVKKDAGAIGGMLSTKQIAIDSAYAKARYVAAGYAKNQAALSQGTEQLPTSSVTFNQTNTSPKALSSAEIYRQTKNQLSVAKGALTTS